MAWPGLLLADEARHPAVRRRRLRVALGQREHEAGAQPVRDPHLRAGDAPGAVVLARGARGDGLHVGAQARLGQRERGPQLARRHPRQEALPLLVGAELHEQVGADEMGVHDARDRDPPARELLDDHRVGRQVEPHAAVFLGDRDPEEPELLHLLDHPIGERVLVVVLLGDRQDLLVHELPDHLGDGALVVGQVEVRGGEGHVRVLLRGGLSLGPPQRASAAFGRGARARRGGAPRSRPTAGCRASAGPCPAARRSGGPSARCRSCPSACRR